MHKKHILATYQYGIIHSMRELKNIIKRHPRRTIVMGFVLVILVGTFLLMLPTATKIDKNLSFINAMFTATSAVCVTGLTVVDTGDTFTVFGKTVIGILIQIGGLGITSIGVITILLTSGRISLGNRRLACEGFNLTSGGSLRDVIKSVLYVTVAVEIMGAIFSFFTFAHHYRLIDAVGVSIFHSVASFNNAGFDIFGGFKGMAGYRDDVWLNLVTATLIIMGGIGFFVIRDVFSKKKFKEYSLHTKIVLSTTAILIIGGTLLLKFSEGTTWLSAFFHSVSARTAGFATEPLNKFSATGILILIPLMFIGASPGSTGGGIKTTTLFVACINLKAVAFNKSCEAFKRKIPDSVVQKSMVVLFLSIACIFISVLSISMFQPEYDFRSVLFEVVSGFGTVGLSTGITPSLGFPSKIVMILTMFIGRVGPLTMIMLWWQRRGSQVSYTEENITVG